ncbi:MAG: MATE family efflux transporter [Lachnospiraceae bacterium]|nr:MATE family efflux transporter [Lachnospiraceae bacterium]
MDAEQKEIKKSESKKSGYEMDMCSGSILKKLLLFSLPLMLSSLLQLLFNAADIIVVGRFAGDNSLAAVGSTSSLINLLTNFFMGLSVGANVLVARYFGAKQKKDLTETVHTAMMLSICSGIILTVIGIIGAPLILARMQTPDEVFPLSVLYLRIYFIGMTAMMLYNFGSAILRAVGDTRRPLYYLSLAGVINVLLNLFFVIVLHMDVAGVATATAVSQCISAFLIIRCMINMKDSVHLELSDLHIYPDKFKRILQIGLPASVQGILFSFSNVIIQSSVNSFGAITVAGNSAAANIEGFVYVAMNAFHQAAISFTGQNVGAAKYERVNKIAYTAEFCVFTVGVVLGNLATFFGRPLLGLYTSSAAVMDAGMKRMRVICRTYALCGMMDVMVGSLRGLGYSIMPMIVSLIGACGLRLIWIFTFFQMDAFHTVTSLYLTYPVSWFITFMTHVICFVIVRRKLAKKWGK